MKAGERNMPGEYHGTEISFLKQQLEISLARNDSVEKENQELRQEVARMKTQISSLRAHDNERKTTLWKKLQNSSIDSCNTDASLQKPSDFVKISEHSIKVDNLCLRPKFQELSPTKEKSPSTPKPPPKPTFPTSAAPNEVNGNKEQSRPVPPPPPPLPTKRLIGSKSVRRVPEVVELYRSLTRRNSHMENKSNHTAIPVLAFTRNMIGEIENRSAYLSAIKSDVEKQKQFINFLTKEVESAAYTEMADVEAFVKWLDEELSSLVDERAVLKHFPKWPERKADALREAAFSYRGLRNLECEVSAFEDNAKEPVRQALQRMQALQDRLEQSVNDMERMRESTSKKYREFQIPWEWMLETGLIGQIKISSLRIGKEYIKRISRTLQLNEFYQEENLMVQGIRFAYRIHQFAGGFDTETIHAFEELKKVGLARS